MYWRREDKRIDDRKPAGGLKARIKNWDVVVLDISVGGMRVQKPPVPFTIKEKISFELAEQSTGTAQVYPGMGFVRAVSNDWVAIQFRLVRYPMMKFIAKHVNSFVAQAQNPEKNAGEEASP